eukprot:gb/GECG01002889.1/.p1 GENE.gb/GECG01002889.1/~~gb/GECG01002889.1/.p1  ORF type:complete len:674 (+),score=83.69 gb/GECG01002889.1/:1-2022(+)
MQNLTILEPFGEQWSSCGYCKADGDTAPKFYCRSSRMRCVDYQDMMFRGWRRSGKILYYPINSKSCCPNYTIRLDVSQFQASKQQNRVVKRVNRHLQGLRPSPGRESAAEKTSTGHADSSESKNSKKQKTYPNTFKALQAELCETAHQAAIDEFLNSDPESLPRDKIQVKPMGKGNLNDSTAEARCRVSCNVALVTHAVLRKRSSAENVSASDDIATTLATVMKKRVEHMSNKDKVHTIQSSGKGFVTIELNLSLDCMFQHSSGPESLTTESGSNSQHSLRVEMVKAQYEEESYQLFRKYQMEIHKEGPDEVSAKGYKRFLVESPLINEPFNEELPELPFGYSREEGVNTSILEVLESKFLQLGVPRSAIRFCALMLDGELQTVGAVLDELAKENVETVHAVLVEVFGEMPPECEEDISASEFYAKLDQQTGKLERLLKSRQERVRIALERRKDLKAPANIECPSGFTSNTNAVSVDKQSVENNLQIGMGTFHQKYYYDGVLVAVAVVDILPSCLSSVYVFYDPDYYWLELGKYSALREIQWVQQAATLRPHLHYYCMGYYIHSCQKMRYKGEYQPSELLCPETHSWVPLDQVRPKLDHHRYCRFAEEDGENGESRSKLSIARILPFFLELRNLSPLVAPQLTNAGQEIVTRELGALYRYTPEVTVRAFIKFN